MTVHGRHEYAVICEDPSPLARSLDGADTASELRIRWEAELSGWRGTFGRSLLDWCRRDEYKHGDEWNDNELRALYVFNQWDRKLAREHRCRPGCEEFCEREDCCFLPNFTVLMDLDEEWHELWMILDANRSLPFERAAEEGRDSNPWELRFNIEELVEVEVYHAFAEWLKTGERDPKVLPLYKAEDAQRRKLLDAMPLFTGGSLSNKPARVWPAGLFDELMNEDDVVDDLRTLALLRRVEAYCVDRAIDRQYFEALLVECSNRKFCMIIRQAYLAGLRLMIQTLLSHSFTIDSPVDLREFVKLAKSVLQIAAEAYSDDENNSLLKFDDADTVRWAYPLLSNIRMHSYRAWWNAGARLEQGGRTPRDTSAELNDIARRLIAPLQRALGTRGVASTFDKRVTFANAQDAIEIASLDWHSACTNVQDSALAVGRPLEAPPIQTPNDDLAPLENKGTTSARPNGSTANVCSKREWELARDRMLQLLQRDELPKILQATKRLLVLKFTYSTIRTAAHRSDALRNHFDLPQGDTQSAVGTPLLDELASQADAHTQQCIERMDARGRSGAEEALRSMPAEKRIEMLRALAIDPESLSRKYTPTLPDDC